VTHCKCDVCRGDIRLQPEAMSRNRPKKDKRNGSAKLRKGDADPLDPAAAARLERLKAMRLQFAQAQDQPAFCIAHDSVLREVARAAPQTLDALARIKGIGDAKLAKFGAAFLEAIRQSGAD